MIPNTQDGIYARFVNGTLVPVLAWSATMKPLIAVHGARELTVATGIDGYEGLDTTQRDLADEYAISQVHQATTWPPAWRVNGTNESTS